MRFEIQRRQSESDGHLCGGTDGHQPTAHGRIRGPGPGSRAGQTGRSSQRFVRIAG